MSPLVWDLAHIAAYEDLWLAHRHAGLELLRPDLAELYDAFETPRSQRGDAQLLDAPEARAYLKAVRERVLDALAQVGAGDGVLTELVVRHELQHSETMRQTLALAGLLPPGEPSLRALSGEEGWLELPAGAFLMGAPPADSAEGFAYDNERPRHLARTGAFAIARRPVTNASWLRFSEGGGYERREWWSDEGWSWKEEYDITHHPSVAAGQAGGLDWEGGPPSATSAGSRPTPSPARTMRGSPQRRSGSGRRPRSSRGFSEALPIRCGRSQARGAGRWGLVHI